MPITSNQQLCVQNQWWILCCLHKICPQQTGDFFTSMTDYLNICTYTCLAPGHVQTLWNTHVRTLYACPTLTQYTQHNITQFRVIQCTAHGAPQALSLSWAPSHLISIADTRQCKFTPTTSTWHCQECSEWSAHSNPQPITRGSNHRHYVREFLRVHIYASRKTHLTR